MLRSRVCERATLEKFRQPPATIAHICVPSLAGRAIINLIPGPINLDERSLGQLVGADVDGTVGRTGRGQREAAGGALERRAMGVILMVSSPEHFGSGLGAVAQLMKALSTFH